MECANKKTPLPMPRKKRRCSRFLGGEYGDNKQDDDGACGFTGEQLRFPCKLRRYVCARCGMLRGEHRYAGIRDELLPPRKRSVFRRLRLVQFKARKEEKLVDGGIWTVRAVVRKRKRAPRRKPASVAWAGLKLRA